MLGDVHLLKRGKELVEPFDPEMVQPASIEFTLDNLILIPMIKLDWATYGSLTSVLKPIDPRDLDVEYERVYPNSKYPFVIEPNQFVLGSTAETINVPNDLVARVEGKSSLGRLGVFVHITAGFCDPGFRGKITLEIYNINPRPVLLYPGMKICQVAFDALNVPAARPYGSEGLGSHYQDQTQVTGSRYGE